MPALHAIYQTITTVSGVPQEPTKAELIAYQDNPDNVPARAADIIVQAYPKAPLIEATVLLSGAKPTVTAWKEVGHRSGNNHQEAIQASTLFCALTAVALLPNVEDMAQRMYTYVKCSKQLHRSWSCRPDLPEAGAAMIWDAAWLQVQDREPLMTPEDCILAEDIVKADPEVVALLKEKYGLTDLALVACDPWSGACPYLLIHVSDDAFV